MKNIKVSASLLSANFSQLNTELDKLVSGGANMIHLDIMDGHFVPNISFGALLIKSLRPHSKLIFDTHLMISEPHKFIDEFCNSGSDYVTIHTESLGNISDCIAQIKSNGKKVGIAIKPDTAPEILKSYISQIDLILIMTVEPGFGGQNFLNSQLSKIEWVRKLIDAENPNVLLSVDGGINGATAPLATTAGADTLVSGSYIFSSDNYTANISSLRGTS